MRTHTNLRAQKHSTIILLLMVSALLPLLFNASGVIAGFVLAVIVLAWLLRARDHHVRNRMVLLLLATLVLLMNGAFLLGVLTDGTWRF